MRSAIRSLVTATTALLLLQIATFECWSNPFTVRPASQCCTKGKCPTMPTSRSTHSTCQLLPATPQNAALPQAPEWTAPTTLAVTHEPLLTTAPEPAPLTPDSPPDLYLHNSVLLV